MPSKKDNLLAYLNTVDLDLNNPRFMSQEEIDASNSSYLIERDYSKYKDYLSEDNTKVVHDSPETWDEKRALAQSGTEKVFNSLGQMAGTFGTSLASTVATLGGAAVGGLGQLGDLVTGEDNTDFMDTMVNNPVMQGINEFDRYLKEDLLPTYYTKEQQESLLSAATGTDLLNGVGFLASNIIPNAAVIKLFGNFSRMANAAKAGKLVGVLDKAVDAGTITNAEKMILGGVGKYFEKAPAMIGAAVGGGRRQRRSTGARHDGGRFLRRHAGERVAERGAHLRKHDLVGGRNLPAVRGIRSVVARRLKPAVDGERVVRQPRDTRRGLDVQRGHVEHLLRVAHAVDHVHVAAKVVTRRVEPNTETVDLRHLILLTGRSALRRRC